MNGIQKAILKTLSIGWGTKRVVGLMVCAAALGGCGGASSIPGENMLTGEIAMAQGDAPLSTRAKDKGLFYGGAMKTSALSSASVTEAFAKECGILVPEYELKWEVVQASRGVYNFVPADKLLAFAQEHNMIFRGHTLVWHSALPKWVSEEVTPENAEQILTEYITTVASHYAGKVHSWDVVNEALAPEQNAPDGFRSSSIWYQLLGPRYVEIAFRTAAQADPAAMLVYNETGLDYDTPQADAKRKAVLHLLASLKSSGVPIHALGVQGHLWGSQTRFSASKFKGFLKEVSAMGLKIIITEMDVADATLPIEIPERDRLVALNYKNYLEAALSEPAVIGVLTWGLSDDRSWLKKYAPRADGAPVRPLPLDADQQRKPAWHAIANALDAAASR